MKKEIHPIHCSCCNHDEESNKPNRRDFLKTAGTAGFGFAFGSIAAGSIAGCGTDPKKMASSGALQKGKAQHISILQTADIHGQLLEHDEFFWEDGKAVYKRRGGMATLKTMLNTLRNENPGNTILLDGGDCFQGSGVAALTEGRALVPLINNIGYDLMLPGNWEVVYGKQNMMKDLGGYNAAKVCANMYHDEQGFNGRDMIFQPYWTKMMAGVKVGFIGYNDPLTPKRQSPDYSRGIHFGKPEENVARYIKILREYENCAMVFLVTHMGLTQQIDLGNQSYVEGIDYILGADTHERVRKPIEAKYAKVTEPGAFASFVGKLDIVVEDGKIKDHNYDLLDVDPTKYKADEEMANLVDKTFEPYKEELNKVVGKTKSTLVRYFVLETPMDNFLTDAVMWKFKPDVALSNGFRFCPPLVASPEKPADITNDFIWSMLPVNSQARTGKVSGLKIWNWLEKELENVFAVDPAKRFGGWVVRFAGMTVNFTSKKKMGERINWIKIKGEPIDRNKLYYIVACEREGDPEDAICRMMGVENPVDTGVQLHDAIREYLAENSPIEPKVEGRVQCTDQKFDLLSQLDGYEYNFR